SSNCTRPSLPTRRVVAALRGSCAFGGMVPEPRIWSRTRTRTRSPYSYSFSPTLNNEIASSLRSSQRQRSLHPPPSTLHYRDERGAGLHSAHSRGLPSWPGGNTERVRGTRSGSSDARYAIIAANVALFLRSSNTTLSYVSRLVCH